MGTNYQKLFYKDYEELFEQNSKLSCELSTVRNEKVEHTVSECPACKHTGLEKIGAIEKDELDYRIIVEKKRHIFVVYRCPCCGKEVHGEIPNNLKEENQTVARM